MAPAPAPRRALLRLAGLLTQLLCAGCLLLGTIAFVLVQQNRTDGAGLVSLWAAAALMGLVFGGLMGRGGLISLVVCAVLDATLGIVLIAIEYDVLRALLTILPASDVATIADIVTVVGVVLLGAFALCLLAVPQALRYTRWMHAETEPRLAGSTARGFPPPPIRASAPHGSVWQLPIVAPEESRSRRRMYFALAGFAIGFGAGIGVLVSSSSQRPAGGGAGAGAATAAALAAPALAPRVPDGEGPETGGAAGVTADSAPASGGASGAAITPPAAPAPPVEDLIEAQRAALAKGDLAAVAGMLAPGVFGFGVDAGEAAEGKDAVEGQLRQDLGELVEGGAKVSVRYAKLGEAQNHAWIALELDVAARGRSTRRFAVTELAAWIGGAWQVVAWHWAVPVPDKAAERMAALGTKPAPKTISSALTGPKALEDAVRAAFASRRAFVAAWSEHPAGFNFGSGPRERIHGGAAVRRVFGKLSSKIRLHDGVRVIAASAWDPAQKDAPAIAFAAANVDYTTKTRAATDLTHTFRVLAVLLLEDGAWKLVQTQWSHGGPIR
ncbi:MAG TPA: nuclear transport factor 2 family protein [Kofleriaceae bacterium]|nr:nuclear transport factor 2 family protein [Kofleriaceae bacterium]